MKKCVILLVFLLFISCDGKVKKYYKNGNLRSIEKLVNGNKNGPAVYYDSLGNIELKGEFKDDLEDGKFENYKNGKLYIVCNFKLGKPQGEWYDYDDRGKLEQYSVYKDSLPIYTILYDSLGRIDSELSFKNNKPDGPFKLYKNGKLALTGFNVNGKGIGDVTYYDEHGKVEKVVPAK